MDTEDFSIQELCDQTGLPRRTIHFYTQQGILPPPEGAGLAARYQQQHLLRLRLIPALRKQGLRLDQIRERFQQSSLNDLQELSNRFQNSSVSLTKPAISQTYNHYTFPGGIALVVPSSLDPAYRQKLTELLDAAQRILGVPPADPAQLSGSESETK